MTDSAFTVPADGAFAPGHVAVARHQRVVAFVVGRARDGGAAKSGIWCGHADAGPVLVDRCVPDSNIALDTAGTRISYAIHKEDHSMVVVTAAESRNSAQEQVRHRIEGFVEHIEWSGGDELLAVIAESGADSASLTSGKPLSAPQPGLRVSGGAVGWRRLAALGVSTGEVTIYGPPTLTVWEFAALADGRAVAVCSSDPSEAGWYHPVLAILARGVPETEILLRSEWQLSSPAVSPDGARTAFVSGWASDRGLLAGEVTVVDLATGDLLAVPDVDVDVTSLSWQEDGALWFAGWQGESTAWGWISSAGERHARVTARVGPGACMGAPWRPAVTPLAPGTAMSVVSGIGAPPEVAEVAADGAARVWSTVNGGTSDRDDLTVAEVSWLSDDNSRIQGLLALPSRPAAGRLPLIVSIHGGPTLAYHHTWDLGWAEVLTRSGYAVLMPNPRGSAGRGQDFARANLGDPAGAEFRDILAGVRYCVDEAVADADRVGVMGSSYGGYLTAWALAIRGDIFRCGVVMAGIGNLTSVYGTANNPPFYQYLLAGSPQEATGLYTQRSPVLRVGPSSSPALILHGELDRCVPVGQAHEMYTAWRTQGVEAELCIYPGEGHQVAKFDHILDQRSRVLDWFAERLAGAPAGSPVSGG